MIVGIAGLGWRGRAVGGRLRAVGQRVIGFDDDVHAAASSGLRTVGTSERLAQQCEFELVACDGQAAEELVRELLEFEGIASLQTIAVCGVVDPRRVQELAQTAAGKGIALVDTPLDGGEQAILAGQATVFAGGAETAIAGCRKALEAFGTVRYVGEPGTGQLARIVNDLLRWAGILAISEVFDLVRAASADASPIREAVLRASGSSRVLGDWSRTAISTDPQEVDAVLQLAQTLGANMPFLESLRPLLAELDVDSAAGLFNLGIADLSQAPASEPTPEERGAAEPVQPEAELSLADLNLAAFPDSGPPAEATMDGSLDIESFDAVIEPDQAPMSPASVEDDFALEEDPKLS